MKIIDLLNKIANEEEVPKRIKYRDWLYEFEKDCKDYLCQYDSLLYRENDNVKQFLNDEVEILEEEPYVEVCGSWFTKSEYDKLFLEEEKKIPEKLSKKTPFDDKEKEVFILENRVKINEIIDYLDYLKSKEGE